MSTYLKIGEFAKMAEVSARALRIYESHGLIRSITRGDNGYRYYAQSQLESIKRITKLKSFGFSLREIRALLLGDIGMDSTQLKDFLQIRIEALAQQAAEINHQRRQLNSIFTSLIQENGVLSPIDRRFIMKFFETVLPFVSVRDLVLFPGNKKNIYVGRPFTKAAIEESMLKHGGKIIIATQKAVEMNDKPDPEQIYEMGCLCQISSIIKMDDGTLKIEVQAKARWHIIDLKDENGIRFCEGSEVPFPNKVELGAEYREEVVTALKSRPALVGADMLVQKLSSLSEPFEFVCEIGGRVPQILGSSAEPNNQKKHSTPFLIDSLNEDEHHRVNLNLARVQEILAEDSPEEACRKIAYLLA